MPKVGFKLMIPRSRLRCSFDGTRQALTMSVFLFAIMFSMTEAYIINRNFETELLKKLFFMF